MPEGLKNYQNVYRAILENGIIFPLLSTTQSALIRNQFIGRFQISFFVSSDWYILKKD